MSDGEKTCGLSLVNTKRDKPGNSIDSLNGKESKHGAELVQKQVLSNSGDIE